MNNTDITKLQRSQLIKHFEQERLEWFAAGMNEADIFRIHFGKPEDNGRGGDYRIWLDERRHTRSDHKYAPGIAIAIDTIDPDGAWIRSERNGLSEVEIEHDLEIALSELTDLQRRCFIEVRLNERTQTDVADELGISRESVKQAISGALKKLKKYFS